MTYSLRSRSRAWRSALRVIPLAGVVLACGYEGGPDAAFRGDGPLMGAVAPRPMTMRGTVELVSPVIPPPAPCLALFNSTIRLHATHLGRVQGIGTTCIQSQIPDPDPPFTPPGPAPYATAVFSNPLWVLTAANGDELWLTASDAVAVLSMVDGSLAAQGTHRVLGGTGRFASSSGELQSSAINEDGQGPDDFESRGWIRY